VFVFVIGCVLIPRFALVAALSGRSEMLGKPVALAPVLGGPQVVGQVSGAAEAFGIHEGMRLGEALARCPSLGLVAPDSERAAEAWERAIGRLEAIGAAVESARPGEAFFEVGGLRALWGAPEQVLSRARRQLGGSARLGAGPTRLCAHAAALEARPRRGPVIVPARAARAFLASRPVGVLRERMDGEWERASVPDTLERLGVRTLGELAQLPASAVADRFGEPGLHALRMANGSEPALRPRGRPEPLLERLELPEGCSGPQLEHGLGLLVDRMLASRDRRGRTLRRLRLGAGLAGGGSWGAEAALREASADGARLRLALSPKLDELPGPATSLTLRALELGPPAHDQLPLEPSPRERRRKRIAEAVRQARSAAGRDAVLRVLEVEPDSCVPERRAIFTPYEMRCFSTETGMSGGEAAAGDCE
jgi:protein ImuB